jgi:hypothetical protein
LPAITLLFGALIAREVTTSGGRGFLLAASVLLAVIAVAFVATRLA